MRYDYSKLNKKQRRAALDLLFKDLGYQIYVDTGAETGWREKLSLARDDGSKADMSVFMDEYP